MSSRHVDSRRCDRSRSRSADRPRDRKPRSRDRMPRSQTRTVDSKSKRSTSRDRKTSIDNRHRSPSRDRDRSRDKRYKSPSREAISKNAKHRSPSKEDKISRHRSNSRENKSKDCRSPSKEIKSKSKAKKSKKKKKRHSSSSSSSSSSEEELKLLQRLEAERQRLAEEKRKQKEAMKANETPEEKRARRVREKQEKERRRRERMGWDGEYQCYTNQDNPFGDSALTHTFVWSKKLAREGVRNVTREELDAQNRAKQLENKVELEKVKQRRLEREAERAARELEAGAAARAREAAQFSSWARQEDAFHLQQARLRSQIRIRDGRAKPIDLLAWYVSSEECVDALEMHEPYSYLRGLQARDLDDLKEDIEVYKELESNDANLSYWQDVQTIVHDEMNKLRGLSAPRSQVHQAVADDVTQIFKGKTGAQLAALQQQIESKISGRQDGIDIGYWENLLSQLKAHMARARLRDRHQQNLRRKLELLKQEQGVAKLEEEGAAAAAAGDSRPASPSTPAAAAESPARPASPAGACEPDAECEAVCVALYHAGRYSPEPLAADALEPATLVTATADDDERIDYLRGRLLAGREADVNGGAGPSGAGPSGGAAGSGAALFEREARRAMGADEAQFSVEAPLLDAPPPPAPPLDAPLADKYRPRKPRYFNRVHTGFEWNKYNQTHYDMDNPPPKIVQGYKFNIFYPDLIDKAATPEFSLKPCADNAEFAVLRFHAGPPYEDIAFKIVNREWEYSYKRGFRCHFHNNIFQLWFHFKRYRYRR